MSPRQRAVVECPYCERDQFISSRGLVSTSFVCLHPDNQGCWCVISPLISQTCHCRLDTRELRRENLYQWETR